VRSHVALVLIGALLALGAAAPPAVPPRVVPPPVAPPPAAAVADPAVRPGPEVLHAPPAEVAALGAAPGSTWRAEPLLVSGAQALVDGEYLYQGWLYDDNGGAGVVDPEDEQRTQFLFAGLRGTLTYPDDEVFADNAADLVELRVAVDDAATRVRVTLGTLLDGDRTGFTMAIGDSETPQPWPHGAGVRSPARLFLTTHGTTGELLDAATGQALEPAPTVTVDLDRNQIEIAIPRSAWDPARDVVPLRAGVGLWDPAADAYLAPMATASATAPGGAGPAGAALFDMAFRTDEPMPDWEVIGAAATIADSAAVIQTVENCFWRDCAQADALRQGDVSAFVAEVDFGALADGVTDLSTVPTTGPLNRILPSAFAPQRGEGIDFDAACGRHPTDCDGSFHGPLQPYTIFVPDGDAPPTGWPLVVLLHPSTGNHNVALGSGYQRQMGTVDGGAIVITALARDAQGDFTDLAEAEVFEVWADVARRYPLDPSRTVLTGYSMGAGGTYKLAERWPDLFARGFGAAAVPRSGGLEGQHLDALHATPTMVWIGGGDEGSTVDQQAALLAELDDQDLPHQVWQFPTSDHLTLATNDEWGPAVDFLSGAVIDPDPVRIRYVVDPANDHADVGVVADHAFWLSGIRTTGGPGVLDVRSEGFGRTEGEVTAPATGQGAVEGGNRGPMPYHATWVDPPAPVDAPAADVLHLDLQGVSRLTVDLARARLSCGGRAEVISDVPVTLDLPDCGGVLDVPAGTSTVELGQAAPPLSGGPGFADFACPARSWVAGTSVLCGGVLTYRDYVYDDFGADTGADAEQPAGLSVAAGDVRYPEGEPPNTADLVDLSLRVDGDRLEVLAELNTLFTTDTTVLGLAIDTDDDPGTGGGEWPGFGVRSDGWDELHTFTAADPLANLIGGSVPRPPGERWRVQAVVAQADGAAVGAASAHAVMNVAFRGPDEQARFAFYDAPEDQGSWFEDLQAAALADADITAFGQVVAVADLQAGGRTAELDEVGPGLHQRVYTSDVTLPPGEGLSYEGIGGRGSGGPTGLFGQVFTHYGRYQPYGLYLPDAPGPHQLGMIHHGSGQNHVGQVNRPGFQADVGDAHNRVLASPLARGPDGYGSDISERDLQDVRADVLAHYDIDESSIHIGGYSQGGYITFRQSMLHPDEYASSSPWVGFSGDATSPVPTGGATAGAVGRIIDLVRNVRHVPMAMVYGGADELTTSVNAEAIGNEFRAEDFPYIFYMHPAAEHFTFALLDEWSKEIDYGADRTRVVDPPRITFRTAEVLGDVDAGIRHDRAYWISQIRGVVTVDDPLAAHEAYIDVDLLSAGCGGEIPVVQLTPGAGPSPVPWVSDSNVVTGTADVVPAPTLTGALANVASLAIDADRACLTGPIEYDITSATPALLRVSDGRTLQLAEGSNAGTLDGPGDVPAPERLGGEDRIATAVSISGAAFDAAETVVVVRADKYADALAAGPLAALSAAPVLLTGRDGLDPRVAAEIERLGATRAVLVGGEAALSPAVLQALRDAGLATERLAGDTRFHTAAAVAAAVVAAGGDASSAYLVEGQHADADRGWPDAVAASGLASRQARPILLGTRDDLPDATTAALAELGVVEVTVVGGQAALTDRTLAMAADPDGDGTGQVALNRIAGATRYETSARVADRMLVDLATTAQVWQVTGRDWPDALAAGPAAAASGGVLLLVDGHADDGGPTAAGWLAANAPVERSVLVGGPDAIGDR
jgi:putative cell wall-binding protein/dienelactone hydrolase